jgi:hypothetical protein
MNFKTPLIFSGLITGILAVLEKSVLFFVDTPQLISNLSFYWEYFLKIIPYLLVFLAIYGFFEIRKYLFIQKVKIDALSYVSYLWHLQTKFIPAQGMENSDEYLKIIFNNQTNVETLTKKYIVAKYDLTPKEADNIISSFAKIIIEKSHK